MEFEQNGEDRAKYGDSLLPRLANDLEQRAVKGLSVQMLERTRHLYFAYLQLRPSISSSVMRKLDLAPVLQQIEKSPSVMRKSAGSITPLSANAVLHFSWTQLIELIRIDDPLKRAFYEADRARIDALTHGGPSRLPPKRNRHAAKP